MARAARGVGRLACSWWATIGDRWSAGRVASGAGARAWTSSSTLPSLPLEGRCHPAHDRGTGAAFEGVSDFGADAARQRRSGITPRGAGRLGPAGLELRLHEQHEIGDPGRHTARRAG